MKDTMLELDRKRYEDNKLPSFQKFYRKAQSTSNPLICLFYKILFVYTRNKKHIEMSLDCQIGPGLYFGHPYCITINPKAILGKNINIHKGGDNRRGTSWSKKRCANDWR